MPIRPISDVHGKTIRKDRTMQESLWWCGDFECPIRLKRVMTIQAVQTI